MAKDDRSRYLAARAALPARAVIGGWLDEIGVEDGGQADSLARRLHAATIPFDSDPEIIERCIVDSILWMSDRADGDPAAAARLRATAARVSASFVAADLVEQPYCVLPDGGEPETDGIGADGAYAPPGTADGEGDGRPMRYDLIYAWPVRVRLNGERCVVRYPPLDGRARVERWGKRPTVVALDDLDDTGRRALAFARLRRRVEVHVRCSVRSCGRAYRGWLNAEKLTVEDTRGETICGLADLSHAKCDMHKGVE